MSQSDVCSKIEANYTGLLRLSRLRRLGQTGDRADAIVAYERLLERITAETRNVRLYQEVFDEMLGLKSRNWDGFPQVFRDEAWIAASMDNKLDKNRNDDQPLEMADRNILQGRFSSAMGNYRWATNMEPSETHSVALHRLLLLVLYMDDWTEARRLKTRYAATMAAHTPEASLVKLALGLSSLSSGEFEEALSYFLHLPTQGQAAIGQALSIPTELCTMGDLGIYITLCALATQPRHHLKFLLEKDDLFRECAGHSPFVRSMVSAVISLDYSQLFSLWETHAPSFQLDIFVGPQYEVLERQMRNRAHDLYFSVFSAVKLDAMAVNYHWSRQQLIDDLTKYIRSSETDARIDVLAGTITLEPANETSQIVEKSSALAKDYIRDSRTLLWAIESLSREDRMWEPLPRDAVESRALLR